MRIRFGFAPFAPASHDIGVALSAGDLAEANDTTGAAAIFVYHRHMRVATTGRRHFVLRQRYLDVYDGGEVQRRAWSSATRRAQDLALDTPRHMFAVPAGDTQVAWVGTMESARIIDLDGPDLKAGRPLEVAILDAVGLGDGRVLAAFARSTDTLASLAVVDGALPDFEKAQPVAVPEPVKIKWPGGIWPKNKETWPEKEWEEGDEPLVFNAVARVYPSLDGKLAWEPVVLSRNEHGIAGASIDNGLVFTLAPDLKTVDLAVRVPVQAELSLHASKTAHGVLVSMSLEGRDGALLHIDREGRVLAHATKIQNEALAMLGPIAVAGDRAFVPERSKVIVVALPSLEATSAIPCSLRAFQEGAADVAGNTAVFGGGLGAVKLALDGEGNTIDVLLPPPETARAPRTIVQGGPVRATGCPVLTLASPAEPSRWNLSREGTLEVTLAFGNAGGAGKGVAVEVAGPGVASGLVEAADVRCEGHSIAFSKVGASFRAVVDALALAPGLVIAANEKGRPPAFDVVQRCTVVLRGVKAGNGLVTVRVTPLQAESGRGAVLQGKSVVVS